MRIETLLELLDEEQPDMLIEELAQAADRFTRTALAMERALADQAKLYAADPARPKVVAVIADTRQLAERTKALAGKLAGRDLCL